MIAYVSTSWTYPKRTAKWQILSRQYAPANLNHSMNPICLICSIFHLYHNLNLPLHISILKSANLRCAIDTIVRYSLYFNFQPFWLILHMFKASTTALWIAFPGKRSMSRKWYKWKRNRIKSEVNWNYAHGRQFQTAHTKEAKKELLIINAIIQRWHGFNIYISI